MLKDECARERFLLDYSPPEDFTNCFWQKKRPVMLIWLVYRFVMVLYLFASFVVIICFPEEQFPWYKNYVYFTRWSYTMELVAFSLAFAVTVERFVKQRKNPELRPMEEMPVHYKVLWCAYTTAATSSVVVTIVYCLFIYTQESMGSLFHTIATHVLNSVFMILDFFLYAIPHRFLHFYMPLGFSAAYAFFSLIYQLCGGTGENLNKDLELLKFVQYKTLKGPPLTLSDGNFPNSHLRGCFFHFSRRLGRNIQSAGLQNSNGLIPIYHMLDWRSPKEALATCAVHLTCVALIHCAFCVLNILKFWLRKSDSNDPNADNN